MKREGWVGATRVGFGLRGTGVSIGKDTSLVWAEPRDRGGGDAWSKAIAGAD